MLKFRILTACALIPLCLYLLFYAPVPIALITGLMIFFIASIEWIKLIPLEEQWLKVLYLISITCSLYLSFNLSTAFLYIGVILWLYAISAIMRYPQNQSQWGTTFGCSLFALIFLPTSAYTISQIYQQPQGPAYLLYLCLLVWAADTGAYFAGKIYGRHKLIPQVSPGKTVEGAMGGILSSCLIGYGGFIYFHPTSLRLWAVQVILTFIFSVFGDLFFSMLKRRVKLKDTGAILPGHGGILDRFDGFMAASLIFYLTGS